MVAELVHRTGLISSTTVKNRMTTRINSGNTKITRGPFVLQFSGGQERLHLPKVVQPLQDHAASNVQLTSVPCENTGDVALREMALLEWAHLAFELVGRHLGELRYLAFDVRILPKILLDGRYDPVRNGFRPRVLHLTRWLRNPIRERKITIGIKKRFDRTHLLHFCCRHQTRALPPPRCPRAQNPDPPPRLVVQGLELKGNPRWATEQYRSKQTGPRATSFASLACAAMHRGVKRSIPLLAVPAILPAKISPAALASFLLRPGGCRGRSSQATTTTSP
mmetsp:Transcript_17084/g.37638  ORF Transcript_17084/g.37638 Transcript_17084/m.37638 type:complete len:279 (+) Transcript_17084:608-1444(+)